MKGSSLVAVIVGAILASVVWQAARGPVSRGPAGGANSAIGDQTIYSVPVGASPVSGSPTAKVTIIEATDFQCPYCSKANTTIHQLQRAYGGDVRLAVKMNPLSFHKFAPLAAQAALAAHEQGKYFEMHDKLFDNQQSLGRESLEKYAQELGLDMERFRAALERQDVKDRIAADQALVTSLGAGGTPSFFINGRLVVGALPFEEFKKVIDEELEKANQALARGIAPEALYQELVKGGKTAPGARTSTP